MDYKLTSWGPRRSLRSPSFYIFEQGYMMVFLITIYYLYKNENARVYSFPVYSTVSSPER